MNNENFETCVLIIDTLKYVYDSSLFSACVGGAIVAVVDWIKISMLERSKRKQEYINSQIINLYGQLYYFSSLNSKIYELHEKIYKAYREEYCEKGVLGSEENIENTIQILNSYSQAIKANNVKIDGILRDNFVYIDIKDRDKLLEFTIHHIRNELENDEHRRKLPIEIYDKLGDVMLYNLKFVNFIEEKIQTLKK
jgi:hypothetical protein